MSGSSSKARHGSANASITDMAHGGGSALNPQINHIYLGDCLEYLESIPDQSIQLIVTSPPYNVGKEYEKRTSLGEYLKRQSDVIRACVAKLKPAGSICWQVGNYVENGSITPLDMELYPVFKSLGLALRNRIVWHFGHGLHCTKRLSGRYETILWFTKTNDYVFNLDPIRVPAKYPNKRYFRGAKKGMLSCNPMGKNPSDVWEIPNVKHNHVEKTGHPAQYPVELVERLVLALTNEGDVVLDPYMGSGSTAVAALMHGRRSRGAETDPGYHRIAMRRVELLMEGRLQTRPMGKPIYRAKARPPPARVRARAGEEGVAASPAESAAQPTA